MSNIGLTDEQWTKMREALRQDPHAYVGQETRCRRFVDGVLWMSRSGAQWRLLPSEYGTWNSVYKRFARWCEQGVWQRLFQHFVVDPDMENVLVDSTIVRAHPSAAGAQKKRGSSSAGAGAQSRRL